MNFKSWTNTIFDLVSLWVGPRIWQIIHCTMYSHVICCSYARLFVNSWAVFWPKIKYINMSLSTPKQWFFVFRSADLLFFSLVLSNIPFVAGSFFFCRCSIHHGYPCVPYEIHGPWNEKSNFVTMVSHPKWWQIRYEHNISHTWEQRWRRKKTAQKMSCCFNEIYLL